MALPSTGAISMSQVRTELNRTGTISLNDGTVRALAGRASGSISMSHLRGKSAVETRTVYPGSGSGGIRGYVYNSNTGSISSRSYGGFTLTSIATNSASPNVVTLGVAGTVAPGWKYVYINGVAYSCGFGVDDKLKQVHGTASVPNAYTIFASTFTIGFS